VQAGTRGGCLGESRRLACRVVTRIVCIVIATLIALSLLWLATETHYRGCVEAATARTATPRTDLPNNVFSDRKPAVDGCSRLPF
jgi:hypothetical protein